jgi:hypothetical protein
VDEVAELGAGQRGVAEVVVLADELVVAGGVGAAGDQDEPDRLDLGEAGGDRRCLQGQGEPPGVRVPVVPAVAVAVARRRQGDQVVGGHPAQRCHESIPSGQ